MKDKEEKALEGRVALVTGSSRGIGAAIAVALAGAGADVIVHGQTASSGLGDVASRIAALGRSVRPLVADLSDEAATERLAADVGRVDVLVNNTDMIADIRSQVPAMLPVGRPGRPHEIADVVTLLATNAFITGQVINVNGGWYMG